MNSGASGPASAAIRLPPPGTRSGRGCGCGVFLFPSARLPAFAPPQPDRLVLAALGLADVHPVEAPRTADDVVVPDVPLVLAPETGDRQLRRALEGQRLDLAQDEVANPAPRGVAILEHALHEPVDLIPGLLRAGRNGLRTDGRNGLRTDGRNGLRTDDRNGLRTDDRNGRRTDDRNGRRTDDRNGLRTDDRNGLRTDDRNGLPGGGRRRHRRGRERRADDQESESHETSRAGFHRHCDSLHSARTRSFLAPGSSGCRTIPARAAPGSLLWPARAVRAEPGPRRQNDKHPACQLPFRRTPPGTMP